MDGGQRQLAAARSRSLADQCCRCRSASPKTKYWRCGCRRSSARTTTCCVSRWSCYLLTYYHAQHSARQLPDIRLSTSSAHSKRWGSITVIGGLATPPHQSLWRTRDCAHCTHCSTASEKNDMDREDDGMSARQRSEGKVNNCALWASAGFHDTNTQCTHPRTRTMRI